MQKYVKFLFIIVIALFFTTSCKELLSTYVRFQNNSATKTVWPIWDGGKAATLSPGQITEYQEINPGSHTIKWKNAATNEDLTTTAWPNAVQGEYYTFPYND